ncbi:alginate lyase family protein [Pseudactinotalea sp. HY158]|uniref:alginate lyase family protein n=1 Tax=Pseudactinotalea sp. HY158 TaxID=2654547 RepID=UPI00129C52B0|nr:alginate lyase family protein [Pseudactinotalea sp. HY158]QGH69687.1 hypothetical protein GCE65_09310 [Pseudactinotalea sp. HY158]
MKRRTVLRLGLAGAAATIVPIEAAGAANATAGASRQLTVWLTDLELETIAHFVEWGMAPRAQAYDDLVVGSRAADLARAADTTPVEPLFYVGPFYETPEELRELSLRFRADAHAAYRLALGYYVTGGRELAAAARSLVLRWHAIETLSPKDDTPLVWANQFPEFVWAADVLRRHSDVWHSADETLFRDLVTRGLALDPSHRTNNWGSWGVVLRLTSAAYLGDRPLFDSGITRWRELLESQFDHRGWQPAEIGRNNDTGNRGICYSHFNLHPLTLAAQIAQNNRVFLFPEKNSAGAGLEEGFETVMRWAADPEQFSRDTGYWPEEYECTRLNGAAPSYNYGYGEILDLYFPNRDFRRWARADRPLSFNWTGSMLTVTHGQAF